MASAPINRTGKHGGLRLSETCESKSAIGCREAGDKGTAYLYVLEVLALNLSPHRINEFVDNFYMRFDQFVNLFHRLIVVWFI